MIATALIVQGASQLGDSQSVSGVSPDAQAGAGEFGEAFSQSLAASGGSSSAGTVAKPEAQAPEANGPEKSSQTVQTVKGDAAPDTDVKAKPRSAVAPPTGVPGRIKPGQSLSRTALHSSRVAAVQDLLPPPVSDGATSAKALQVAAALSSTKPATGDAAVPSTAALSDAANAGAAAGRDLVAQELSDAARAAVGVQVDAGPGIEGHFKSGLDSPEKAVPGLAKGKVEANPSSRVSTGPAKDAGVSEVASLTVSVDPSSSRPQTESVTAIAVAGTTWNAQPLTPLPSGATADRDVISRIDLRSDNAVQHGFQGVDENVKSSVPARTQGISLTSLDGRQAGNATSTASAVSSVADGPIQLAGTGASDLSRTVDFRHGTEVFRSQASVDGAGQRADAAADAPSFHPAIVSQIDPSPSISSQPEATASATTGITGPSSALSALAVHQKPSPQSADARTTITAFTVVAEAGLQSSTAVRPAVQTGGQGQGHLSPIVATNTVTSTVEVPADVASPGGATAAARDLNVSPAPAATPLAVAVPPIRTPQAGRFNGARPAGVPAIADASTSAVGVGTLSASHGDTAATQSSSPHELTGPSVASPAASVPLIADGVQPSGAQAAALAVSTSQHLSVGAGSPSRGIESGNSAALAVSSAADTTTHSPRSFASGETSQPLSATSTTLEVGVHGGGTQGWLRIRAEMDGQGAVTASLAASSPRGEELLKGQMPALNAYLHGEQMSVTTTLAERGLLSAAAGGHNSSLTSLGTETSSSGHNGSSFQGGGNTSNLDGQGQSERRDAWEPVSGAAGVAVGAETSRQGFKSDASNLQVTALDGSGRWLNVRA